jgi:hypothetical protein
LREPAKILLLIAVIVAAALAVYVPRIPVKSNWSYGTVSFTCRYLGFGGANLTNASGYLSIIGHFSPMLFL